ncbi:MAG TPA: hypothetical protein PLV52_01845 [Candidatus Omnitrophota bacterium]|nr:hypothetical protein [Candidatus Omnitrophota bacterium]
MKIILIILSVGIVCASIDVCGACEDTHEDCHYCVACCYAGCHAAIINPSNFSAPSLIVSRMETATAKVLEDIYRKDTEHPPKRLSC